jgi:formate dehydrogenase major subunit
MASTTGRAEKVTGTFCAEHPPGLSGKRCLSPFPAGEEIEAILAPAQAAGRIEIRCGCALGSGAELDLARLRDAFDAVFLAIGLPGATSLGAARGVTDAIAFLRDVKCGKIAQLSGKVAILGGGNTAIDAAVTAKQLGAEDVYLVYRRSLAEMPAWPDERKRLLDSGCHPMILTQPLGYATDEHGTLTGLRIARTELATRPEKGTGPICRNGPEGAAHKLDLSPFPASGRRAPRVLAGTESVLGVDLVVEALGQGIPTELRAALEGLDLSRHGLVATRPDSQATSLPGVFAGGDLVNGGTTAVQGIAEGMRAAEEIDRLLAGRAAG